MNTATFNHQICSHKNSLENFALKFTKNLEDADDLVQDTLLKAIRFSTMYEEGTNLRGWLFTIMRNTFINNFNKKTRTNALFEVKEDLGACQMMDSADRNKGENIFMMEDIQRAMAKLPTEYAFPFCKYFEGYKYHEIAEELNIPIGTVKTRIFLARQILKKNLKMYSSEFKKSNLHS